jgi:hypothetical protein
MKLRKTSLALGTAMATLAAVSVADSALAANPVFRGIPTYYTGGGFLYRAPQPNQSAPGATSRPPSSDMRGAPSMGGRGMRGSDRINGSLRRR